MDIALRQILLGPLHIARFIELAELLYANAFTYGKLGPRLLLPYMPSPTLGY
jgi:hypothetical protein